MACKEQKKKDFSCHMLDQVGLAGPLVHPESEGCWESRHGAVSINLSCNKSVRPQSFSTTVGAILANVTVFELFKKATGIAESNQSNQIYKLDLETLEGDWISFHHASIGFQLSGPF